MHIIVKAIDSTKNKIRQFPVTFADTENYVIIYDFLEEHESFLNNLVKNILSTTKEGVQIFCTPGCLFDEIGHIRKVIIKDDVVSLILPKPT